MNNQISPLTGGFKIKIMSILKKDDFKNIEQKFISLTDKETFIKEASYLLQAVNKNKQLAKCDRISVIESLMNVANIGLTLNPVSKLAYLVPRWNSSDNKTECCLEPSYQGLVKLLTDTGSVRSIYSYVVYEGDEFEEVLGTRPEIIHKPKRQSKNIIMVYAVAVLPNGSQQIEVMSKTEVEEIREYSSSYQSYKNGKIKTCIWITNESEMYRKTVIRRICKYLPKSDKWERINNAINLDEQDYTITSRQENQIETLLLSSNISPEESQQLYRDKSYMNRIEAEKCIKYLKDNQIDNIAAGNNYSQTDIIKKIKNEVQ